MSRQPGGQSTPPSVNVALIGARGVGKTTVGRRLAALLGWAFVDTDECVARTSGRTIAEIFAAEGESGFRQREATAVATAAAKSDQVIAVGGGAVLDPRNRATLKTRAFCVWLTAAPDLMHRRIAGDSATRANRPALTALDPVAEVRQVLAERTPLYRALADYECPTDERSVDEIAASLAELLTHAAPQTERRQ